MVDAVSGTMLEHLRRRGKTRAVPREESHKRDLASLHDVATGKLLWRLRCTFDRRDRLPNFALSPDGRLALIALISRSKPNKMIGLFSMSDGKVLQTLPSPRSEYSMGFCRERNVAWVITWDATLLYNVN